MTLRNSSSDTSLPSTASKSPHGSLPTKTACLAIIRVEKIESESVTYRLGSQMVPGTHKGNPYLVSSIHSDLLPLVCMHNQH